MAKAKKEKAQAGGKAVVVVEEKKKEKPLSNRALLQWFMEAEKSTIFELFQSEEGAEYEGEKDGFVFIPGTDEPSKRVLLVAHADTVWESKKYSKIRVRWDGNLAFGEGANGLGADDRAGCAMLWLMRGLGASIILTDEEESGCVGARKAVDAIGARLGEHAFAIQMDRRGDMQAVFYDAATKPFREWLIGSLGGPWREERGSFSDVAEICPQVGINGVNLSAGFFWEHQASEMLVVDAWLRSVQATKKLVKLAQEGKLPEFGKPAERRRWRSWDDNGKAGEGADSYLLERWLGHSRHPAMPASYATDRRANGHMRFCSCVDCERDYYPKSIAKKSTAHSDRCVCLNCKRAKETAKAVEAGRNAVTGHLLACACDRCLAAEDQVGAKLKLVTDGKELPKGEWKPDEQKGWRRKDISDSVVIYDTWDGDPATLQLPHSREQREESAGKADGSDKSSKGSSERRTTLGALLHPEYDDLTDEQQQASRELAEKLAIGLVRAGRIKVENGDVAIGEAFYELLVLPAATSGVLDAYSAAEWEHRLIFSNDESDPRVEGFLDGCLWGLYAVSDDEEWVKDFWEVEDAEA